jgi:predicted amidohydrolase YtcJ
VLEMFGVTKDTPDPAGGKYDRDADGVPNGVLRENAMNAIASTMKQTHEKTALATMAGAKDFLSYGITSVHDAGTTPASMRALVDVIDGGKVPLRVYAMVGCGDFAYMKAHIASALSTGFGNERLKLGAFKLMTDGSSSGPTSATRAPYAHDPSNRGILYLTQDQIDEWFCSAGEALWQLTAHAVGDRAIDMVISGIERSMELHRRRDARHRIEHCAMAWEDIRKRIKRLGIVPCMQPTFINEFGDGYVLSYGPVRASGMFPAASCIKEGIPFGMGTDCPVTFCDPMLNVYAATTRRTLTGNVVGAEEAITLSQALHAYTFGSAYAAHEETIKGTLEPGKLADIAVIDGNPFDVEPAAFKTMRARMTIVGGKVAFER